MSERAYQETKTTTGTSLDPVEYAVLSQALMAAGREMGVKLIRSSYSNIVREAQDASAALFDRAGNVVAQAELIPMQRPDVRHFPGLCGSRAARGPERGRLLY